MSIEKETWQQALERYNNILEMVKPKISPEEHYRFYKISFKEKETKERIAEFEKKYNCTIPQSLKSLYLGNGTFSVKDGLWNSINIYSNQENHYSLPNIGGLVEMIDQLWGGRPEFEENFSVEEIGYLNKNYFVFGHYFHDDNVYSHFYFDRDGNFEDVMYDQDDFGSAYDFFFKPLLTKSLANKTFDELISSKIDKVIENLKEEFS